MYSEYPFHGIEEWNKTIRRYLTFDKFRRLLDSKTLFFCRLDKFEDKFEGVWPDWHFDDRRIVEDPTVCSPNLSQSVRRKLAEQIAETYRTITPKYRKKFAANCWNASNQECPMLWSRFADMKTGVALVSSPMRLKESIECGDRPFSMCRMMYLDHRTEKVELDPFLAPVVLKRAEYVAENELRAFIYTHPAGQDDDSPERWPLESDNGQALSVNLQSLCDKVVVSPLADDDFRQVVESALQCAGLSIQIEMSELRA